METWAPRQVQELLAEGEALELAFPVRYPLGPLPFGMLLRGCIVALTDRQVRAFAYSKLAGRPAEEIWSAERAGQCAATLSANARRLQITTGTGEVRNLVVTPKHRKELERFTVALSG